MSDRFVIAPYDKNSGLKTNYKPWLIPDEAFSSCENAYIFRGRIRKRFGSRWLQNDQKGTRLRVKIGQTGPGDTFNFNILTFGISPTSGITPAIGQMFSVGDNTYTVNQLGTPANLLINGTATLATLNTTTGDLILNGTGLANTNVYFYPALPVMGIASFESNANNIEPTIAFDTRFAYTYVGNGWERIGNNDNGRWKGTDVDFFYTTTWVGDNGSDKLLFATNFNHLDNDYMRYYDGTTWNVFRPLLFGTTYLDSARILIPFHNHLVALNTWEDGINYQNRARWGWVFSPIDATAFRTDLPGHGSGLDAATTESIICVQFIQDRLIVYFEKSTWELAWTGNAVQPFVWQQLNTELGAESTFSVIPFDRLAIAIGSSGIHACNGIGVDRIDVDVPTIIEEINNQDNGPERIQGIRDFGTELLYWSYPDQSRTSSDPYPNKVLVYNYRNNTWAINDDSITSLGYFQSEIGASWDSTTITWDDPEPWDGQSGAPLYRNILAGNQQGFTFIIDSNETTNSANLSITDIAIAGDVITITSLQHGLAGGDFIYLQDITGTGTIDNLNGIIYKIISVSTNTFLISEEGIAGTYNGYGTLSRVSNMKIYSKEFNFYFNQGMNFEIESIDFMVDRTDNGEVSVGIFTSTNINNNFVDGNAIGSILGNNVLDTKPYNLAPYEKFATRLIHSFYPFAQGSFVQIYIYLSDDQMMDTKIRDSDFQLHSMTFVTSPTSRIR